MLIDSKRPSNTIQGNLGISGTNLGINIQKPDHSNETEIAEYPKRSFTQSPVSFDYFINYSNIHFAPNWSNTNISMGFGYDYNNKFLIVVTPGYHIVDSHFPMNTDFIDDPFINIHASFNISSSKRTVILVSNDVFQSQFIETSKHQEFSNHISPYFNKFALTLFFYDTKIFSGLEISFLNSYNMDYYGGGIMFTFGFR